MKNKARSCIKALFITLLTLCALEMFGDNINDFITTYLSKIDLSSMIVKWTYSVSILVICIYIMSLIKIFNQNFLLYIVCTLIIYALYRYDVIHHPNWEFAKLYRWILYLDILFIAPVLTLYPKVSRRLRKSKNNLLITKQPEFIDQSINKREQDKFGYYEDAEQLIKIILSNREQTVNQAMTIGLQGKWGSGKTSYLNMMKVAVNENYRNKVVLLRFNPWLNHNYNQLANSLLGVISDGVDDLTIKSVINDYAKVVSDAQISWLSKYLNSFVKKTEYADELFEKVSNCLGKLDRLIIVQVDDLDRLSSDEIFNTIKLIRNVANFKNTVFVVAYDNEYVINSLKQVQVTETYLEKVFNVPYQLPTVPAELQKKIIKERIKSTLIFIKSDNDYAIDSFFEIVSRDITMRNAIRLCAEMICNRSNISYDQDEIMVDLLDYMLVSYLGVINVKAYQHLANYESSSSYIPGGELDSHLLGDYNGCIYRYKDTKIWPTDKSEQLNDEQYKKQRLEKVVGYQYLETVNDIFITLFDDNHRMGVSRLKYVSSYRIYFSRKLVKENVYQKDFYDAFTSGSELFKEKLKEWNEKFDGFTLGMAIKIMQFDTKQEWERALNDILYITPTSHTKWSHNNLRRDKTQGIFPEPGFGLLDSNKVDITQKQLYVNALKSLLFDKETISKEPKEMLQKKFAIIVWLCVIEKYGRMNIYEYSIKIPNLKDVYICYWNRYVELGIDYNDFDEDFWVLLDKFNQQDYLDIRNMLKSHIKSNITNFSSHYSASVLNNTYTMVYLFRRYEITSNGSVSISEDWKPYFIEFLESFDEKAPKLIEYMEACKKDFKINFKQGRV